MEKKIGGFSKKTTSNSFNSTLVVHNSCGLVKALLDQIISLLTLLNYIYHLLHVSIRTFEHTERSGFRLPLGFKSAMRNSSVHFKKDLPMIHAKQYCTHPSMIIRTIRLFLLAHRLYIPVECFGVRCKSEPFRIKLTKVPQVSKKKHDAV